jgi:NAD(P)-dependent dehydrogenase (short-subunit alcohol dehydrogenase family)
MAGRFLDEGMQVVLADIELDALEATAADLASGGDILAVHTDVTEAESVSALASAARERFGTFHVVCNNAGVGGHMGLSWEAPLAEWRWVFAVNLWGVVHGIRSFVPTLVAQGEGHVVNTASQMGWDSAPVMGPYVGSKHAVVGISAVLRDEMAATNAGVGVSVLCPGPTNTALARSTRNWIDRLGDEPSIPTDPVSETVLAAFEDSAGWAEPSVAANAVVEGIVNNRFVVTSHPVELIASAEKRAALARACTPQS